MFIRVHWWLVFVLTLSGIARADFSYQETVRNGHSTVSTAYIKGNRMAIVKKNRTTVIDLNSEMVIEIDFAKKTYTMIPFAQLKAATQPSSNISFMPTDRSNTIGVVPAKEFEIASNDLTVDCWVATVPGYDEVKAFQRKTGEKLGYIAGLEDFGEIAWAINKLQGAPLACTRKDAAGALSAEFSIMNAAPVADSKFDVPSGFRKVR